LLLLLFVAVAFAVAGTFDLIPQCINALMCWS
jgi:hypothetical protein